MGDVFRSTSKKEERLFRQAVKNHLYENEREGIKKIFWYPVFPSEKEKKPLRVNEEREWECEAVRTGRRKAINFDRGELASLLIGNVKNPTY